MSGKRDFERVRSAYDSQADEQTLHRMGALHGQAHHSRAAVSKGMRRRPDAGTAADALAVRSAIVGGR